MADEFDPYAKGVEYQITQVDPTAPETKGMVYQVHKVTEEVAALLGGKVYRARIIKDPDEPTVTGKVYQVTFIDDPDDPTVKGKVYNAICTGSSVMVVVGPGVSPLDLPDAIVDSLEYVKAFGDCENRNLPEGYQELEYIEGNNNLQYINTGIVPTSSMSMYFKGQFVSVDSSTPAQVSFLAGARDVGGQYGFFLQLASANVGLDWFVVNGRWTESHTRANGDVVEMKVSNSLAQIWINGTSVGTHQYTPNDTTQYPLFLNGLNSVGQPFDTNVNSINRVYRFTIEGIADMRPARRLSDGVLGMYDTIRKRFFTNAGSGSFVAGRDIGGKPLPTGYTRLAYIEGTGTQYFDTGIKIDQDTEIEAVFQRTSLDASNLYGINTNGNTNCCTAYFHTSASTNWRFDDDSVNLSSIGGLYDTTMWHRTIQNKYGVKVDSNEILAYTTVGTFETGVSTPLFARYSMVSNTYGYFAYARVSSFIIRKNGTEVLNLVPAKRNSDSAIGMYDMVSGTFFTNAGTGTFAYSEYPTLTEPQDIWCNNGAIKAIRPIKYLESTGTQYIDTGLLPTLNTKLVVKATRIAVGGFAGSRDGADANSTMMAFATNGTGVIIDFNNGNNVPYRINYTIGTGIITIIAESSKDARRLYDENGTLLAENTTVCSDTFTATKNMTLFNCNGGSISGGCRIYYAQIWDGDTLVRDMIPALDANNIPCMFDKVEGKCYYNVGTGQFIAGYLPAEYEELEYIQGYCSDSSDSTIKASYIDTGIILPADANFYLKSQLAGSPTTNSYLMCGTRTTTYAGSEIYVGSSNTVIDWYGSAESDRLTINDGGSAGDIYEIQGNNKTLTVFKNGSNIGYKTFSSPTTPTLTFWLNSRNTNNQVTSQTAPTLGRIYRFTVAGVCDLIPARKRSNGHIGMYDLVRRQFFENAGEGQFTFGKLPILPETYTRLEYLESTGTQYIDTGIRFSSYPFKKVITFSNVRQGSATASLPNWVNGSWANDSNNRSGGIGLKTNGKIGLGIGTTGLGSSPYEIDNPTIPTTVNIEVLSSTSAKFTGGSTDYDSITYSGGALSGYTDYLFGAHFNGTTSTWASGVKIYGAKYYDNNVLVRDFIPAKRNSDGVVGMYDIMNDVFLTNQGTGTFAYGAEIPDSRESYYYVDGLVEKVGTRSAGNKNLFNGVFEQGGLYQGNLVVADTRIRTPDYITLPAGTYTISCASAYEVWIEKNNASSVNWYSSYTFTATSTDKFKIAVRSKTDPSTTVIRPDDPVNVQVEAGSTATAYVPYCDGGLAVCENLLGIGSTQDVQEILTGTVTRKFAVVVLDGSEVWVDLNNQHQMYQTPAPNTVQPSGPADIVSTHFVSSTEPMSNMPNHSAKFAGAGAFPDCGLLMFKETDFSGVSQWMAWLRQQYDNGTPVIVVYPLSADETESVAGQTLTVSAGDNTVEIVQASIDDLLIEAKYEKEG